MAAAIAITIAAGIVNAGDAQGCSPRLGFSEFWVPATLWRFPPAHLPLAELGRSNSPARRASTILSVRGDTPDHRRDGLPPAALPRVDRLSI